MRNADGYCQYSTPCSWCTKWDKECDKQVDNNKIYDCNDCLNEGNKNICRDCTTNSTKGSKPFKFQYHYWGK